MMEKFGFFCYSVIPIEKVIKQDIKKGTQILKKEHTQKTHEIKEREKERVNLNCVLYIRHRPLYKEKRKKVNMGEVIKQTKPMGGGGGGGG